MHHFNQGMHLGEVREMETGLEAPREMDAGRQQARRQTAPAWPGLLCDVHYGRQQQPNE
jgi:hypothetical protein